MESRLKIASNIYSFEKKNVAIGDRMMKRECFNTVLNMSCSLIPDFGAPLLLEGMVLDVVVVIIVTALKNGPGVPQSKSAQ